MTTSQQDLKFVPVHCPKCKATLCRITPVTDTFSIEIKCWRCTRRRRIKTKRRLVNVVVRILLEPVERPAVDSEPENLAHA